MKQEPLLMNDLSPIEQSALANLIQMPGWAVVEKLHMSACKRATEDCLKQDPAAEGYDRKVLALTSRARERNEFSLLLLSSVEWHAKAPAIQEEEKKNEKAPVNPIVKPLFEVQRNKK